MVSRCFPGGYNVKLYISRGRLAWWLLAFLHSDPIPLVIWTSNILKHQLMQFILFSVSPYNAQDSAETSCVIIIYITLNFICYTYNIQNQYTISESCIPKIKRWWRWTRCTFRWSNIRLYWTSITSSGWCKYKSCNWIFVHFMICIPW